MVVGVAEAMRAEAMSVCSSSRRRCSSRRRRSSSSRSRSGRSSSSRSRSGRSTPWLVAALAVVRVAAAVEIDIDFDQPRNGPVCVKATRGDVLHFQWDEWHNLHEMPDYDAYDGCKFGDAVLYADAKPNPTGVKFDLDDESLDRYFSCSKICSSHGHKVHVCIAASDSESCQCDEPMPSPAPTAGAGETVDAAPTPEPTPEPVEVVDAAPTPEPTQMLDVAPSQEPTETVDAACGDSTSWHLLGVVVFACLSLT